MSEAQRDAPEADSASGTFLDPRPDRVEDDENLYRRIRDSDWTIREGRLRLSSQAFSDKSREPSVDRAKLRENDPSLTMVEETDGVVSLYAYQVRIMSAPGLSPIDPENPNSKRETIEYLFDVRPDPIKDNPDGIPDNPAHAVIYGNPAFDTGSLFKRVIERLARKAEDQWEIKPKNAIMP